MSDLKGSLEYYHAIYIKFYSGKQEWTLIFMNISLLKLTWPLAFVGDGATWKPTVWMGWSHVGPSFREWAKKRVWRTTKAGRGRV